MAKLIKVKTKRNKQWYLKKQYQKFVKPVNDTFKNKSLCESVKRVREIGVEVRGQYSFGNCQRQTLLFMGDRGDWRVRGCAGLCGVARGEGRLLQCYLFTIVCQSFYCEKRANTCLKNTTNTTFLKWQVDFILDVVIWKRTTCPIGFLL